MIEHAWSSLSNCLTSVKLSACLPGKDKPTNKQSLLTKEERREKEMRMLDNAADDLAMYWNNLTYYDHVVIPLTVPSASENLTYNMHEDVHHLVTSSRRIVENDAILCQLRKDFKFYAKHAKRQENEFVILKCQFFKPTGMECDFCRENPPIALNTLKFIKEVGGRLFQPEPSNTNKDHYKTFLELKESKKAQPEHDIELGRCMVCPEWYFTSEDERNRHRMLLHPNKTATDVIEKQKQTFTCNFKVNGVPCGSVFPTHYMLGKHKEKKEHKKV